MTHRVYSDIHPYRSETLFFFKFSDDINNFVIDKQLRSVSRNIFNYRIAFHEGPVSLLLVIHFIF